MSDLYGRDILLDAELQAVVAANGEAAVSTGPRTAIQNIRLRLATPLGALFYDKDFGSLLHYYFHAENTPANRLGLVAEIEQRVSRDSLVQTGSVTARIVKWDHLGVLVEAKFSLIEEASIHSLVIGIDNESMDVVIQDVNPY